jgi:hypothetical protein
MFWKEKVISVTLKRNWNTCFTNTENGLLKMVMVIKIKSATPLLNFQNPQSPHKTLSRNFNILESGIDFSLPFKCQNFKSVPRWKVALLEIRTAYHLSHWVELAT